MKIILKGITYMARILIILSALMLTLPTLAHHGFRGTYNSTYAYWLEGEVVSSHYGLPHTEIDLRLSFKKPMETYNGTLEELDEYASQYLSRLSGPPTDALEIVEIEFPEQRDFFNMEETLKKGDRIVVIALRGCESPRPFRGQWVLMPDGSHVKVSKKSQKEVKACASSSRD